MLAVGTLTAQFVTSNDPVSDAIRYLTNGVVSHCDIRFYDAALPSGIGWLGAHQQGGVQVRPFNYAKWTVVETRAVELPNILAAITFARAQIGKPYNMDAIANMALHRTRLFSMDQPSWFCDELLYAICLAGGVQLLGTDNPLTLTPQEVFLSPYWCAV